ncbi:MAG: TolC family protein [Planctomycetes bacterium]|nr:TolC family protein [Planctomycetota bacterium]
MGRIQGPRRYPDVFTMTQLLFLLLLGTRFLSQEPAPNTSAAAQDVVPLRLEDVVALADRNAPALRQARLSALAAEGGVTEAGGMYDPVFFADLTYSYLEQPTSGFFSTFFSETETTTITANQGLRGMLLSGATYEIGLREQDQSANFLAEDQADVAFSAAFTQPLLRGGWELVTDQQRRTAQNSREEGYEGVRQAATDSVQAAVDAYWDLLFAIEDVKVKEFGVALAAESKAVTEARFQVGSVAEVEVVQTEAEIASREDALLTARNTVRQAQDRLRLLITQFEDDSVEWGVDFQPISELPEAVSVTMDWRDALDTALAQRGDLRQERVRVRQAEMDWQIAKSNTDPKLDLVLSGNSYGQDTAVGGAFTPVRQFDFPGFSVGLVFEIPIGNRTFRGAESRTRATYLLRLQSMQDMQNQIASEVRDAVRAVNFYSERVAATAKAKRVASRQLDAEQRRLREGVSTNFQVLQFQDDLLAAQSAELGALTSYAKAVPKLNTVQGLQWDGASVELAGVDQLEQEARRREGVGQQR